MTDQDLFNDIAGEDEGGFSGEFEYGSKKVSNSKPPLPSYKVWNPNPQSPPTDKERAELAGKFIMTTVTGRGDEKVKQTEVTEKVRAVILYTSFGRQLNRGTGKSFQTVCSSHDGASPSVRISKPLCNKASASDVATIFSQWKGYDQAKVDATVAEVTEGTGQLQICGIKATGGFISLCPFARKDPVTGAKASCKQHVYVQAYDIDRKREFKMQLTGRSIEYGKFIAPFHEFFRYLRSQGPSKDGKSSGLPCYAFRVDLSAAANGAYWFLNVENYKPIESPENRAQMKQKAVEAKEEYAKWANYVPEKKDEAKPQVTQQTKAPEPEAKDDLDNLFEDDDIPF